MQEAAIEVPEKLIQHSASNIWALFHMLIIASISYSLNSDSLKVILCSFGICIGLVFWMIINPDKFMINSTFRHIPYIQIACISHIACCFLCIYESSELDYTTRQCKF
jgi:hypothetical protein